MPDAIDGHARRQWILTRDQPTGQGQPRGMRVRWKGIQHGQRPRLDRDTRLLVVTTNQEVSPGRMGVLRNRLSLAELGILLFELLNLLPKLIEFQLLVFFLRDDFGVPL